MKRTFPAFQINITRQPAEIERQTIGKQEKCSCYNKYRPENNQRYGKLFHLRGAFYASMALQKVDLIGSRRSLLSSSRNFIRYGCCIWNASAS